MVIIELLYVLSALLLALYGLNSMVLTWLYWRHRSASVPTPEPPNEWPYVTVQLPIYNELHTVQRVLEAAASFDYPQDRLEIQLLDDSNDDTRQVAGQTIACLQRQGIDVVHVTRSDRAGFKAGALAESLARAKGELIAVFDADFLPSPDFLRRVVPYFTDPRIGCVQTRWEHLNREYSLFTQIQAVGVDGHFIVEQTARSRAGLFINFNGSAGVWRRACIESAGGWQADTLTEDLDLSYRAQLCGWRIRYLNDVRVPAELPAQINAFKRQQSRWAQGSIQTALKMLRPLLHSGEPWSVKLEGAIHLTNYLVHPLILVIILLTWPMTFSHRWVLAASGWLVIAALGPPLLYAVSLASDSGHCCSRLYLLPLLVLLGIGLALNNSFAVVKAVLRIDQSFQRTPKFALRRPTDPWVSSVYVLDEDSLVWGELGLAALGFALLAAPGVNWRLAPWLLLNAGSFSYVAALGICQAYQRRHSLARRPDH